MFFSIEILNLIFYCAQQFGMALGVGAETIVLIAYLISIRDGMVDSEEERFAKAARTVTGIGIFCIIASGVGITITHYLHGEASIILEPAFLFKWSLVCVVCLLRVFNRGSSLGGGLFEGFSGGTWYALFLVHILAPMAGWSILGVIYGAWLVGFVIVWTALVFMMRGSLTSPVSNPSPRIPLPAGQQPYVPHQPTQGYQKGSAFPAPPSFARAYSPTPPVPATPTSPLPPPPPPSSGAGTNDRDPTSFLKKIQVMPHSPDVSPYL